MNSLLSLGIEYEPSISICVHLTDEDNVLVLNQLVKQDGTIDVINNSFLTKKETYDLLNNKLDEVFAVHLTKWLDKKLPSYLEKYFKDKNL